jgi:3-carboxy-cis,cis-muconate cycloisomerase
VSEPGLFDGVLARRPVRAAVSERAWPRALLDAEAAPARARATAGLLPAAHADEAAVVHPEALAANLDRT